MGGEGARGGGEQFERASRALDVSLEISRAQSALHALEESPHRMSHGACSEVGRLGHYCLRQPAACSS